MARENEDASEMPEKRRWSREALRAAVADFKEVVEHILYDRGSVSLFTRILTLTKNQIDYWKQRLAVRIFPRNCYTVHDAISRSGELQGKRVVLDGDLLIYWAKEAEENMIGSENIYVLADKSEALNEETGLYDGIFLDSKKLYEGMEERGAEMLLGGRYFYAYPAFVCGTFLTRDVLNYRFCLQDIKFVSASEGFFKVHVSFR